MTGIDSWPPGACVGGARGTDNKKTSKYVICWRKVLSAVGKNKAAQRNRECGVEGLTGKVVFLQRREEWKRVNDVDYQVESFRQREQQMLWGWCVLDKVKGE